MTRNDVFPFMVIHQSLLPTTHPPPLEKVRTTHQPSLEKARTTHQLSSEKVQTTHQSSTEKARTTHQSSTEKVQTIRQLSSEKVQTSKRSRQSSLVIPLNTRCFHPNSFTLRAHPIQCLSWLLSGFLFSGNFDLESRPLLPETCACRHRSWLSFSQ